MKDWEGRKKKGNEAPLDMQIRNILPKANEIVNTSEQVINSIYPFDIIPPLPSKYIQVPFEAVPYDANARSTRSKFSPSRQSVSNYFERGSIIYDKFNNLNSSCNYPMNIYSIERLKQLSKNDFIVHVQKTAPFGSTSNNLEFDSRFQSGNLSAVAYNEGLYCMLLHNDVNTSGYTNWFYFSVTSRVPVKAKFAIMNYGKAGWPTNMFPGIWVWITGQNRWTRRTANAQCEANRILYPLQQADGFNTLYFEFEFRENQKVFFAYTPPYTYTDLLAQLDSIEEKKLGFFHRKLAGTSLMGNRLELITITNFEKLRKSENDLPVIVLLARTHAGETSSSWIMHQLINYLVSGQQEARTLRDSFIFKIFPMVNPDGVIHGNYRCSLIGRDLNRRWKNPVKDYYPEVYFIKNQIIDTADRKQIRMVLDLHGHTQKRKTFFYGCADKVFPHRPRLFPYLASKLCTHFQFSFCNFAMEKSKESTARMTLHQLLKTPDIFTVQTSQFGMNDQFLSSQALQEVAQSLARAIHRYYKLNSLDKDTIFDEIEEELLGSPSLLKMGCEPSEGSDSQPSICNINFDKINKMSMNLQARPRSQNTSVKRRSKIGHQTYKKGSIHNLRQSRMFSIDKSRDISEKKVGSVSINLNGATSLVPRRYRAKDKRQRPKFEFTKDTQSINRLNQLAAESQKRPVRMINFELLIDDSRHRKGGQGFESLDMRANHPNFHVFQNRCMFRNKSFNWNRTML